jgi:ribosomal protein L29
MESMKYKQEVFTMDEKIREQLKDMSREERASYFAENKTDILGERLETVNGGLAAAAEEKENPNSSEVPYKGNWYSSFGFVCDGEVIC